MPPLKRDHGGGLDDAVNKFGGRRSDWLDLSTGINPNPYTVPEIPLHFWHDLPDELPKENLLAAAHQFWNVPDGAEIVPASGVSAIIAILPRLAEAAEVSILSPTYNEFAASFTGHGWSVQETADVQVRIHPNNPDGCLFEKSEIENKHVELTIIDESFCDICPEKSLIELAQKPDHIILKGTGKFWGLAGLRLGFAIGPPELTGKISQILGPWNISGPAQFIGQKILSDSEWARATRYQLATMAVDLDGVLAQNGLNVIGGTDLFRLAETDDPNALRNHLCQNRILTRIFPYSKKWIRLGLPADRAGLSRLSDALKAYR